MTSIGFFSTDFVSEPIVDERKSALTGRQEFVRGQQRLIFGGTFLQRGAMPAMELNKHGYDNHLSWRFEVAPDGHIRTLDVEGNWHDPDVFWSQRWMHRDGPEQMRRARATGQQCWADLDDAFHALSSTNIASKTTSSAANPDFNREHYWKMLAECDAVTVSTQPLKREMDRIGANAFVIRNAIQLERWQPNDPGMNSMFAWIGGVAWRSRDLQQLKINRLGDFLEYYGLPWFHGGDSQDPTVAKAWDLAGLDPTRIKITAAPLTHIATYTQLWRPVGVSLIPLERCAFNESKSWLKQLESCAAGVPYVVSAKFPEQELLINEGTAGRQARNDKPQQWLDHWTDLLDPDVRREEGAINRKIAEKHDIVDRWVDWDDVYKQLI